MSNIDNDTSVVYLVRSYIEDELAEIFVASTEDKMHEMADVLMEENELLTSITSRPIILDTIRLNETLH